MTFAERMDASRSTVNNSSTLSFINRQIKIAVVTAIDVKEATLNGVATGVVTLHLDALAAKVAEKADAVKKNADEKVKRFDEMSKQKN